MADAAAAAGSSESNLDWNCRGQILAHEPLERKIAGRVQRLLSLHARLQLKREVAAVAALHTLGSRESARVCDYHRRPVQLLWPGLTSVSSHAHNYLASMNAADAAGVAGAAAAGVDAGTVVGTGADDAAVTGRGVDRHLADTLAAVRLGPAAQGTRLRRQYRGGARNRGCYRSATMGLIGSQ